MEIDPKIYVPICIEQGSIYHFNLIKKNKDGTNYEGDRFFIVLNVNPKTDEVLILTTITKKVKNAKKFIKINGEDLDTLVKITPSDFPYLSQDSIINCNRLDQITLQELIKKIKNGGKPFRHKLPKIVIGALVTGVMKSKQISPDIKELIV